MKERKMLKRFGAAFTAFAVVSSLGSIAAFADEDAVPEFSFDVTQDDVTSVEDAAQADVKKVIPEEEADAQDVTVETADATQVQITEAKATIVGDNLFRINVTYAGVAQGGQTTVMAYKASDVGTPLGDLKIEYVNQDVTASSVTLYVKSQADVLTEDNVLTEPDVLVKIGGTNAVAAATIVKVSEAPFGPDVMPGDPDGDGEVTMADVRETYKYAMGNATPDDQQLAAADLDGDGEITMADVRADYKLAMGG